MSARAICCIAPKPAPSTARRRWRWFDTSLEEARDYIRALARAVRDIMTRESRAGNRRCRRRRPRNPCQAVGRTRRAGMGPGMAGRDYRPGRCCASVDRGHPPRSGTGGHCALPPKTFRAFAPSKSTSCRSRYSPRFKPECNQAAITLPGSPLTGEISVR